MLSKKEQAFFEDFFLTNPTTGERMGIISTEGAERGHDCLVIVCEGITGKIELRVYIKEL